MSGKVYFYHGKSTDGHRFTVAAKEVDCELRLTAVMCNPKDVFIRKMGCVKAEGRLDSHKDNKLTLVVNAKGPVNTMVEKARVLCEMSAKEIRSEINL
jgi:hypothetical protein